MRRCTLCDRPLDDDRCSTCQPDTSAAPNPILIAATFAAGLSMFGCDDQVEESGSDYAGPDPMEETTGDDDGDEGEETEGTEETGGSN